MVPAKKESKLGIKELLQLAALMSILCGLVTSIVAYIHADVTIPKILNRTTEQIEKALERHSRYPHPISASKQDVIQTRDLIKEDIEEWKTETRTRLDRIERKL